MIAAVTEQPAEAAPSPAVVRRIWPANAPGIPVMGHDFLSAAVAAGDTETRLTGKGKGTRFEVVGPVLEGLLSDALYSRDRFTLNITVKGGRKNPVVLIPGHLWGREVSGPVPADVMVVGKMLGQEEVSKGRHMVGPTGQLLLDTLRDLGIKGLPGWYVTNLLKCGHPETGARGDIKKPWIDEFMPLLQQELRIVRPQYILCLGADAAKAILGPKATVKGMEGRVVEYTYPIDEYKVEVVQQDENGELVVDKKGHPIMLTLPPRTHTALVMVCTHPAAVLSAPEKEDEFAFSLAKFGQLVQGIRFDKEEAGIDHRVINTLEELENLADEIEHCQDSYLQPGIALLAVDAEWHGEHPQDAGSYLRTIQISWKHKTAACIEITHPGGEPKFEPNPDAAIEVLQRICKSREDREVRIAGQFFVADMEWLEYYGLDLLPEFMVPEDWRETKDHGGIDTGYAMHALREVGDYKLETMAMRYTTAPRYDVALSEWKAKYCQEHGLTPKNMDGYGACPPEILNSYGLYDSCVTRRLAVLLNEQLDYDSWGNNCREAFWITMRAMPAIYEMQTVGLVVDKARVDKLTTTYLKARDRLEQQIRTWANWDCDPKDPQAKKKRFNIRSVYQVREFLFGEKFNGKENKVNPGVPIRIRPEGAKSLFLEPLYDTGKRPKLWGEIKAAKEEHLHTPSTNKAALAILAQESQALERQVDGQWVQLDLSKQVTWIRHHRFTDQVLKSTLRPPETTTDPEGEECLVRDKEGFLVYAGGIPASICDDGRVRTHIYPTKETGRYSSARPPMQNFAGQREAEYKIILGDDYEAGLRSIIIAGEGFTLVDADFLGAELMGAALMSGDEQMMDHCLRNQLPEDDDNYYDIHSALAVRAFKLDCPPTKTGLASVGKKNLRVVAKSVIFGKMYGRGAKAIALAVKEQGVYIEVEEAQAMCDALDAMYPKLAAFFQLCENRSLDVRWMCGAFGRFRRFPEARDDKTAGDIARQGMNFPIQNLVSDAMSRALDHLYCYRQKVKPIPYRLNLTVHDSVVLEVPNLFVPEVIDTVLPYCMTEMVPIYPCHLDGRPLDRGPYHLGADAKATLRWGEPMLPNECWERGYSSKYAGWKPFKSGYVHSDLPACVWTKEGWYDEVKKEVNGVKTTRYIKRKEKLTC